jgi:hypothetical protein
MSSPGDPSGHSPSADLAPRRILPTWARAADGFTLLLLALAVSVILFGGFRARVAGYRVSVTSGERLIVIALVVAGLRHLAIRRPALPVALWRGAWAMWKSPAPGLGLAIRVGLVSRLVVLLVGLVAVAVVGFPFAQQPGRISDHELVNLSARWDSTWYLGIASEGYTWRGRHDVEQNIAFFPAFPFLMWLSGFLVGARQLVGVHQLGFTLVGGVAISILAFTWALAYLYRLAREDVSDEEATGAVVLLAAYPFAVFYGAAYTESLFLLTALGAIYHLRRGEFGAAGAWGLVAGLTRPNGCLLSVPLAFIALGGLGPSTAWLGRVGWGRGAGAAVEPASWPRRYGRTGLALLAAAMPGVGMLIYSWYIYLLTGHPFTWAAAHRAWGRDYRGLDELYGPALDAIARQGLLDALAIWQGPGMNFLGATFALLLLVPVTVRLGPAYGAFTALNLVPPLLFGGWLSMGRLTAVLFPVFLYLAIVLPRDLRAGVVTGFAVVQGLVATVFFTWRTLY